MISTKVPAKGYLTNVYNSFPSESILKCFSDKIKASDNFRKELVKHGDIQNLSDLQTLCLGSCRSINSTFPKNAAVLSRGAKPRKWEMCVCKGHPGILAIDSMALQKHVRIRNQGGIIRAVNRMKISTQ